MRKTRWTVCIDWKDADVEDTCEIVVFADSAAEARSAAAKKWRLTVGAEWPSCRLVKTFVLTDEVKRKFLY